MTIDQHSVSELLWELEKLRAMLATLEKDRERVLAHIELLVAEIERRKGKG